MGELDFVLKGYSFHGFKSMELTSVKLSCETNFFLFSIESLILRKMDRLTITQRIKMIKTNYKNGDPATVTYRALILLQKS